MLVTGLDQGEAAVSTRPGPPHLGAPTSMYRNWPIVGQCSLLSVMSFRLQLLSLVRNAHCSGKGEDK